MKVVLRFLFLPEFGRSLRELRNGAGRIKDLCGAAFARPPKGELRWSRLREPSARLPACLGGALAGAGAGFAAFGASGLISGKAEAQSEVPVFDFSELDPFEETSQSTRTILDFLNGFRPGGGGQGPAALSDMLYIFNGGVLVLAGFLLVYHTIAGTVATAREGRWGFGGWEVLRLVIAVGLMVPLPPGGLNGGQHIVLGLARVGGDFANTIWQPFSDDMLGESEAAVPLPNNELWRSAIARALVVETCRAVANAVVEEKDIGGGRRREGVQFITRGRESGDGTISFGYHGWTTRNLCGAIRFRDVDDGQLTLGDAGEPGDGSASRILAGNAHYRAFAEAERVNGLTVLEALESIAVQIQPQLTGMIEAGAGGEAGELPGVPDLDALLEPVGSGYLGYLEEQLGEAARVETEDRRSRLDDMERDVEWLAAASFINTIAYRTGSFHSVSYGVPDVVPPNYEQLQQRHDLVTRSVGVLVQHLERGGTYRPSHLRLGEQGMAGSLPGLTGTKEGLGGALFGLLDLESVFLAGDEFGRALNPIGELASFGSSLIGAALGTYTGLLAATVATNATVVTVAWVPLFGKSARAYAEGLRAVWDVGGAFVNLVLGILLISGVVLTFVLPLIPFVRFLFGILGWLISVVEAFLAITVFAAAHVTRGEGNQLMTSVTRQGWLFLPGLLLRPALMLFGFVLGYWVFVAGITVLNGVFVPYLRDADDLVGIGVVGFLTMVVVYVFICYALMNGAFKLIDLLPSVALEWIGGRGSGGDGDQGTMGGITSGVGRLAAMRLGR